MASDRYKIRNHLLQTAGPYSAREIIRKINDGILSGNEEVAKAPYTEWRKIASHPSFYDVFIKKLYASKYAFSENTDKDHKSASHTMRNHTHAEKTAMPADDDVGTRQGDSQSPEIPKKNIDLDETMHRSVIDELFKDSKPDELIHQPTTGIMVVPADDLNPPEPRQGAGGHALQQQPSDDARGMSPPQTPDKPRISRKLVFWVVAVCLTIFLLFQIGRPSTESSGWQLALPTKENINDPNFPKDEKKRRLEALIDEGDDFVALDIREGYRMALDVYRRALFYDDKNLLILGKIAETAARVLYYLPDSQFFKKALQHAINAGRKTDPHYSGFYRAEALAVYSQHRLKEAQKRITLATETDPVAPENALAAAEITYALGDLKKASQSLVELIKIGTPSYRARVLLAQIYYEQGKLSEAYELVADVTKQNPLHAKAFYLMGEILSFNQQIDHALGHLETAGRLARLSSNTDTARAYFRLGMLYAQRGQTELAQTAFSFAWHYDPDNKELVAALQGKKPNRAKLKKLVEVTEYGAYYLRDQGSELVQKEKTRESIPYYQGALLLEPYQAIRLIELGEAIERDAFTVVMFQKAINLYQRALEVDPKSVKAHVKLGLAETDQYNFDKGHALLSKALEFDPNLADVYVAFGKHYFRRHDYSEALNHFVTAAKISPSDSEVSYYAGQLRLLFKKESSREALHFFSQAYNLNPQNYEALAEWLKLKVVFHDKNFALKFIRNLLQSEPQNASLYWVMGEVYEANREYRRAIMFYHKSLDINERSSRVRMSLGRCLETIGQWNVAIDEYKLAATLNRRNGDGYFRAGELLLQQKKYAAAETILKDLISVSPNYPGAHRSLSQLYHETRKKDLAIEMMKIEVEKNPQNAKFRLELAELLMEYELFEDSVKELTEITNLPSLTKAPEFVNHKIRGYLLLSRSLRALNQVESALASISLGVEIDPNDPELHKELGYVYFHLQRDKEAVEAFEFYLTRKPAATDAIEVQNLIKRIRID